MGSVVSTQNTDVSGDTGPTDTATRSGLSEGNDGGTESPPSLLDVAGNRSGSSLGSIVPTVFTWSFGGHSVYVTGAWDSWSVKVPLARAGNDFTAVLSMPVGSYQYKFIVDGNWKHSPSLPTETDQHGNLNNFVVVSPHYPEYDSNVPLGDFGGGPPSPVESYDFSMPSLEDYTPDRMPNLPPLFKIAPLGTAQAPAVGSVTANPSAYVTLNHLFRAEQDAPGGPTKTMSSVCRYKREKYVTTVLVMNSGAQMFQSNNVAMPEHQQHLKVGMVSPSAPQPIPQGRGGGQGVLASPSTGLQHLAINSGESRL